MAAMVAVVCGQAWLWWWGGGIGTSLGWCLLNPKEHKDEEAAVGSYLQIVRAAELSVDA